MKAFVKVSSARNDIELQEFPIPTVGDNEILVRVHAVGVGIHDEYWLPSDITYPYPIGIEAAGVVQEVGANVAAYRPNDRVAYISPMQRKGGTWAEYAVVDQSRTILRVPDALPFTRAAALPIAGDAALRAFSALPLTSGESLFIAGASGAIGTLAVQIAKAKGIAIAASASAKNQNFLRGLGADLTVDYNDPQWSEQVRHWHPDGLDAAIAIQPGTTAPCVPLVRDGGRVIDVSNDKVPSHSGVLVTPLDHGMDIRREFSQLMHDVAEGKISVVIEKQFSFEDGLEALAKVQTRHARGKLVLSLGLDEDSRAGS